MFDQRQITSCSGKWWWPFGQWRTWALSVTCSVVKPPTVRGMLITNWNNTGCVWSKAMLLILQLCFWKAEKFQANIYQMILNASSLNYWCYCHWYLVMLLLVSSIVAAWVKPFGEDCNFYAVNKFQQPHEQVKETQIFWLKSTKLCWNEIHKRRLW